VLVLVNVRVCSVADRLKEEQSLDERMKNEFMLQQLVGLISALDLSDELSRSAACTVLDSWCRGVAVAHCVKSTEVTLQRAWLVLGWVTVYRQVNHLGTNPAS